MDGKELQSKEMNLIQINVDDVSMEQDELVRLNLRGSIFLTKKAIFEKIPNTYLQRLFSSLTKHDEKTEFFFDRNPTIFHSILDFYNTGKLHIPAGNCVQSVRDELRFWGIDESSLSKCCWKQMYKTDEDLEIYENLSILEKDEAFSDRTSSHRQECKSRVWTFLNQPNSSVLARIWFIFIILMAILSLLVYGFSVIITVPRPQEQIPDYNFTNIKLQDMIKRKPHPVLLYTEILTNIFLLVDLILRLFSCPCKKKFIRDIVNVVEFLSVLASFLFLFVDNHLDILTNNTVYWTLWVTGWLYAGRVFRILRLSRHCREMAIMKLCFNASLRELGFLALSFIAFSLIFAALMLHAEAESPKFKNLFICYWWSVVTMTTVGYGDQIPDTVPGYIIGTLTAVSGILLLAMPIAILSSSFNKYYNCFKVQKRYFIHTRK